MAFLAMATLVKAQTTNFGTDGSTGGYGYSWANSAAAGGPVYEWIDISTTGTRVTGLGDDNVVGPVPLGIDFKYYWNTYNSCYVGSNGYIMFEDNQLIAQNANGMPQIPLATDNKGNFIAGLLGDLTFTRADDGTTLTGAKVLYQTIGSKFIITYDSVRFWNNSTAAGAAQATGMINFQIVLDGSTNIVTINYKKVAGPFFTGNTNWGTFGMENVTGQLGVRWRKNPTTAQTPNTTSYRITPPANPTYQFRDVKAKGLFNPRNQGSSVFKDNPTFLQAYVQNAGTVKIKTPITTKIFLFDEQENDVFNSTFVIDSMNVGETRLVTFPAAFTATLVQQLDAQLILTYQGDQLAANNTQDVKLVVIDTSQGSVDLRFTKQVIGDIPDANFSRKGGMILDAPYHPFKMRKVSIDLLWPDSAFISQNTPDFKDSLSKTFVEVFLGDGPGNSRGTLLTSFTVDTSLVGADYDTVGALVNAGTPTSYFFRFYHTLNVPYNWTDKPIYVGYNHLSSTGFIWNGPYAEVNSARPSSNRALEITGGVWGEDRGKDSIDYAVSVIGTITPENPTLVIRAGGQVLNSTTVVNLGLSEFGAPIDTLITIGNSGADTLRISGASASGSGWVVASAPASKVGPGDSTKVKVRFNGSSIGTANGELFINCNDQAQPLSVTKFTVKSDYVLSWTPTLANVETDSINIVYNALLGNKALATETGDIYIHTGVITSGPTGTSWEFVQGSWGTAADSVRLIPMGNNKFRFKVRIKEYYGLPYPQPAFRLGMVFRNSDGTKVGKTRLDSDFFVPVTFTTAVQNQLSESELSIFPNPVQDQLYVNLPAHLGGNASIQVLNSLGQVVYSNQNRSLETIPVSNLKSGVYVLSVKAKGFSENRMFIKN